jgi:hypothetical protein
LTASPAAPSKRIADAKAQFRSLAELWADTRTSTGRLMLAVHIGEAATLQELADSYDRSIATMRRVTRAA